LAEQKRSLENKAATKKLLNFAVNDTKVKTTKAYKKAPYSLSTSKGELSVLT